MRETLTIILAAALISVAFEAVVGPTETLADRDLASPIQNDVSIYGLHVALPEYMTNFPKELVPLP
jgi:hypothetical protein